MLKTSSIGLNRRHFLLVRTDNILVAFGLLVAVAIGIGAGDFGWQALFSSSIILRLAAAGALCSCVLYFYHRYDPRITDSRGDSLIRLFTLCTVCSALMLLYLAKPDLSPGAHIGPAIPIVVGFLLAARRVFADRFSPLRKPERVLIVGTGRAGISLVRHIISRPELNLQVVGFLHERGEDVGKSLVNPRIIGAVNEVEAIAAKERVDRIVVSLFERRGCAPISQLVRLRFAGIPVQDVHTAYEQLTERIPLDLSPSSLIFCEGFRRSALRSMLKRTVDVAVSVVALLLHIPVMALVALAIWRESGSPILFRQVRIGHRGREFEILKFRSMRLDAEAQGPCWAQQDDQRVTRVGRIIRKYRLDELPQLFNVLRGEMSFVGPRPERPHFCALLEKEVPFFAERYSVRPGITGWAQIKYQYGSSIEDARAKLEFDLFYIKHLSLPFDLMIILQTVGVVLLGRGSR